jgi:hypothetical protein
LTPNEKKKQRRSRVQLILLALLFATPAFFGTYMYYFSPPDGRTNYGTLIEPQITLPPLTGERFDGKALASTPWAGKWWMVSFDEAACPEACAKKLFMARQLRLTQGKDADKVERVLFLTDNAPLNPKVLEAYPGTLFVRSANSPWASLFAGKGVPARDVKQHIFLVDPMGNLMMHYGADADPNKMKKDLTKLLRLSSGWQRSPSTEAAK